MSSLMLESSSSLEEGVSVYTFFPFAMRQVGMWSLSSSVRLVKRDGTGETVWIAMLATSSSCTPYTCHPSYTCPSSILSSLHSSCWGNRLCSGQFHHTHSIASSCFFSCTYHHSSSCTCCRCLLPAIQFIWW